MADDLDDLLDEVESQLLNKNPKTEHTNKAKQKLLSISIESNESKDDLTAAINDICNIPEPPVLIFLLVSLMVHRSSFREAEKKEENSSELINVTDSKRRCFSVYLGGSSIITGLSSKLSQRACSNIRCISCDFKVSMFDDFVWNKNTDYMFLRNNMPDFNKLKKNLETKKGWRAYGCQCQFCAVELLTDFKTFPNLKWVCGQH